MIFAYLRKNWIITLLVAYELVAVLLSALQVADIGIPCLFTYLFGVHCLGCGMTHAAVHMLTFHFKEAWEANPLSFFVIPLLAFAIGMDLRKFAKQYHQK